MKMGELPNNGKGKSEKCLEIECVCVYFGKKLQTQSFWSPSPSDLGLLKSCWSNEERHSPKTPHSHAIAITVHRSMQAKGKQYTYRYTRFKWESRFLAANTASCSSIKGNSALKSFCGHEQMRFTIEKHTVSSNWIWNRKSKNNFRICGFDSRRLTNVRTNSICRATTNASSNKSKT